MTLPKQINQAPIPSSNQSKNWRLWVALYHDSHLSLPDFCRLHKLPYSAAKNWPRRLEKEQKLLTSNTDKKSSILEKEQKAQFHPIQIETALENAGSEGFFETNFSIRPINPFIDSSIKAASIKTKSHFP